MLLQENIPLAPLTTLGVGGPARFFVAAATEKDVRDALHFADGRHLPFFILGGGSNLVVADSGWPGLVLQIALRGMAEAPSSPSDLDAVLSDIAAQGLAATGRFRVAAGEDWDAFVAYAVERGCAGIECLSGIPGTVGGTPVQNVGAYGQEVSETIAEVIALDIRSGDIRTFSNEECNFAYRTSVFNTTERSNYIILSVTFQLRPGGAPRLEYGDLKRHFAAAAEAPTLQQVRDAVRQVRQSKAMLIVPGDEDCRSAGSFFKNPIVTEAKFEQIRRVAAEHGMEPPSFATPQGIKVPAAWLVEQSGFRKGTARGAVGISRRHALAIVNRGNATAADIVEFQLEIRARVRETFAIELHPEPVFVGFEFEPAG